MNPRHNIRRGFVTKYDARHRTRDRGRASIVEEEDGQQQRSAEVDPNRNGVKSVKNEKLQGLIRLQPPTAKQPESVKRKWLSNKSLNKVAYIELLIDVCRAGWTEMASSVLAEMHAMDETVDPDVYRLATLAACDSGYGRLGTLLVKDQYAHMFAEVKRLHKRASSSEKDRDGGTEDSIFAKYGVVDEGSANERGQDFFSSLNHVEALEDVRKPMEVLMHQGDVDGVCDLVDFLGRLGIKESELFYKVMTRAAFMADRNASLWLSRLLTARVRAKMYKVKSSSEFAKKMVAARRPEVALEILSTMVENVDQIAGENPIICSTAFAALLIATYERREMDLLRETMKLIFCHESDKLNGLPTDFWPDERPDKVIRPARNTMRGRSRGVVSTNAFQDLLTPQDDNMFSHSAGPPKDPSKDARLCQVIFTIIQAALQGKRSVVEGLVDFVEDMGTSAFGDQLMTSVSFPSQLFYDSSIWALARTGQWERAMMILRIMPKRNCQIAERSYYLLLKGYLDRSREVEGEYEDQRKLTVDEKRDGIRGSVAKWRVQALSLMREAQSHGWMNRPYLVMAVLGVFRRMLRSEGMWKKGRFHEVLCGSTAGESAKKDLRDALITIENDAMAGLPRPPLQGAMSRFPYLHACEDIGDPDRLLRYFDLIMRSSNTASPDKALSYACAMALNACDKAGYAERAIGIVETMEQRIGQAPTEVHCRQLVRLLARLGQSDVAYERLIAIDREGTSSPPASEVHATAEPVFAAVLDMYCDLQNAELMHKTLDQVVEAEIRISAHTLSGVLRTCVREEDIGSVRRVIKMYTDRSIKLVEPLHANTAGMEKAHEALSLAGLLWEMKYLRKEATKMSKSVVSTPAIMAHQVMAHARRGQWNEVLRIAKDEKGAASELASNANNRSEVASVGAVAVASLLSQGITAEEISRTTDSADAAGGHERRSPAKSVERGLRDTGRDLFAKLVLSGVCDTVTGYRAAFVGMDYFMKQYPEGNATPESPDVQGEGLNNSADSEDVESELDAQRAHVRLAGEYAANWLNKAGGKEWRMEALMEANCLATEALKATIWASEISLAEQLRGFLEKQAISSEMGRPAAVKMINQMFKMYFSRHPNQEYMLKQGIGLLTASNQTRVMPDLLNLVEAMRFCNKHKHYEITVQIHSFFKGNLSPEERHTETNQTAESESNTRNATRAQEICGLEDVEGDQETEDLSFKYELAIDESLDPDMDLELDLATLLGKYETTIDDTDDRDWADQRAPTRMRVKGGTKPSFEGGAELDGPSSDDRRDEEAKHACDVDLLAVWAAEAACESNLAMGNTREAFTSALEMMNSPALTPGFRNMAIRVSLIEDQVDTALRVAEGLKESGQHADEYTIEFARERLRLLGPPQDMSEEGGIETFFEGERMQSKDPDPVSEAPDDAENLVYRPERDESAVNGKPERLMLAVGNKSSAEMLGKIVLLCHELEACRLPVQDPSS